MQEQQDHRSSQIAEEIRRAVSADDVLMYRPVGCFYLEEDQIYSRLAFFLSSIILSIYDQTPDVLRENVLSVVGLEPVKFDLSNPLHIGVVSYYYHVLTCVCSICSQRSECLWLSVLKLLRPLFKTQ